jgi:thiosulfate dehydrogenase [quinone] large subunit
MSSGGPRFFLTSAQQAALIFLRTLVGWHFLYEGYYKMALPAWSTAGAPLAPWTSEGYLRAASGPLAWLSEPLVNAGWTPWIDRTVKVALLLIGLSLVLGLFTRAGGWGALTFLTLVYALAIPVAGVPQAGSEGAYLIVDKTLIEAAAVCVLLAFNTGTIAGLDLLLGGRRRPLFRSRRAKHADAAAGARGGRVGPGRE